MHDFVSYLFYLLQRGMRFAVPAALICGLILAVCYAVCRKKGRRFPWDNYVFSTIFDTNFKFSRWTHFHPSILYIVFYSRRFRSLILFRNLLLPVSDRNSFL